MPRKQPPSFQIIPITPEELANVKVPVPERVMQAAKKGLQLRKDFGYGGTEVGEQTAKDLCLGRISLDKVLHISNYFPRHAGDNLEQKAPPSPGYIAWLLWGGDPGRAWSSRIAKRIRGPQ